MIDRILTVGGYTLVSRVTGFLRDVVMAAVLGAGPVADAFLVAFRLPNHFRAIFAEGAFSAAFVPAYARIRIEGGAEKARLFADRIFTLLLVVQLVLLALAVGFTPAVIRVLAPGFESDPGRFTLAVALTRVTFPYLLAMTLVSLYGGMLNALDRFAAPAAAPILLNLSMMATLMLAAFFPSAGHAAAWGVLIAGALEAALLAGAIGRLGELPRLARMAWDADVKRFFIALGPATIGSGGVQLALFADTIIASFLPAGAISALYYADRLNQLPIGVIGIAVGTVLLPEMSRLIARGDAEDARRAQSRAIEFTLLLSLPCLVAFLIIPDLILRALFARGAFTAADAAAAGATLRAYALGLLPFVLIRSMVAMFFARGNTATPVTAALTAVPVNIAFKILLMGPLAQVGLALATTIGAWINFLLVLWFGVRAGYLRRDADLFHAMGKLAVASAAIALVLGFGRAPALDLFAASGHWRDFFGLVLLAAAGGAAYVGVVLALFGRQWLALLRRRRAATASATRPLPDPQAPLE
ncbi:MAG: murein biosynthesis integral membrane protein MurJ [Hyphomicrobiales bacterium]|nr:murein biosynthesis integral membrane protein MurJ [Hyphomicrobiales bacterium]MBV9427585.1 murein biosynthesis integral membrane protein MurJ [Bradyrhizobiaceae bacterium]